VTVRVRGRRCRCGALGCLEAYAGAGALVDRWREAGGRPPRGADEETALAALLTAAAGLDGGAGGADLSEGTEGSHLSEGAEGGHLSGSAEGSDLSEGAEGADLSGSAGAHASQGAMAHPGQGTQSEPVQGTTAHPTQIPMADPVALAVLEETAEYVGAGLSDLVNLFQPERILIGGWAGLKLGPRLLPALRRYADAYSLRHPAERVSIDLGELGPDAVTVGAASLTLADFFARGGRPAARVRDREGAKG
jgi:predicted NBD/HSP70 family sugar kinase